MIAVWLWPTMTGACALCLIGVIISLTLYGLDDPRGQRCLSVSVWGLIVFCGVRVLGAYVLAHL